MRHKKSGRKFNRTPSHRKALLNNLAIALVKSGRITTTLAKAKTLRGVVEPLVTLALRNDVHARRQAYVVLGDRKLVARLFDDIGPLFTPTGGYTRVIKLAQPRKGDAAPMAIIEFVKQPKAFLADGADADTKQAAVSQKPAGGKAVKPAAQKAAPEKAATTGEVQQEA